MGFSELVGAKKSGIEQKSNKKCGIGRV